jgi:hypothetical protein
MIPAALAGQSYIVSETVDRGAAVVSVRGLDRLRGSRLHWQVLLVTCSVVSRTPSRRVVDTSGRGVARHLISVWVVGASSCG